MNNEQQELLDEVYENYKKEILRQRQLQKEGVNRLRSQGKRLKVSLIELLTKEEFINKCQTDSEFSEKWGLTIEERELSLEERAQWLQDNTEWDLLVGNLDHDHIREVVEEEAPTKLIKVTYNDKTTESYE